MNLQELIDFHVAGAESCEAYAVTPGASEAKNKDIAKHYTKRAKWHRDAVELMKAGKQRLTVAEKRAEMLEREFKKLRDVAHGCYQIASSYSGCIDGVEEHGGDDHEDPSCAIHHRLYYAMFDADAALKPAEESERCFHCNQPGGQCCTTAVANGQARDV